jgi:hypothetical protein
MAREMTARMETSGLVRTFVIVPANAALIRLVSPVYLAGHGKRPAKAIDKIQHARPIALREWAK